MTPRTIAALIALTLCCATVLIVVLCKGDVRAAIKIPFASFSLETKERGPSALPIGNGCQTKKTGSGEIVPARSSDVTSALHRLAVMRMRASIVRQSERQVSCGPAFGAVVDLVRRKETNPESGRG